MLCNFSVTCTININGIFLRYFLRFQKKERLWKALKIDILKLPCNYLYEIATQTRYFHLQLNCLELTVYFIMKLNILEKSKRRGRVLGTPYLAPPRINISHSHGKAKGISIRTGQKLSFRCNWNFSRLRIDIIS